MFKKVSSVFIVLIMLFSLTATAESAAILTVGNAEGIVGGSTSVDISISENSNVCGGNFILVYDRTSLKITDIKQTALLDNYSCSVNIAYSENSAKASWAGTEELTAGGTVFTVTFSILRSDSFNGKIGISEAKLADIDANKIETTTVDGEITVKASATSSNSDMGTVNTSNGTKDSKSDKTDVTANTASPEPTSQPTVFSDVAVSDWFYNNVKYVTENDLMNGIGGDKFAPEANLTRAMLVTVLYRLSGSPELGGNTFTDVASDAWYEKAVAWASFEQIVLGVGENTFMPDENITREQIAAILFRYAKFNRYDTAFDNTIKLTYTDAADISEYAADAVKWSVNSLIISGRSETELAPQGTATRAEIAAILQRFIEKYNK